MTISMVVLTTGLWWDAWAFVHSIILWSTRVSLE